MKQHNNIQHAITGAAMNKHDLGEKKETHHARTHMGTSPSIVVHVGVVVMMRSQW